jgi:2-dehydro-3-deoxygluconokinase
MNVDVVTFGEAMLRLSPPRFGRLEQAGSFDVEVGGSELNVAVGLTRLGMRSAWVSKVPATSLGRMVLNRARALGVDVGRTISSREGRQGLYFVEFGASPRASSVLYDRSASAASLVAPGEVDWADILDGVKLFHVSGITPALSRSAAEATAEAIRAAKKAGCLVSYDLNYRKKLWTPEEALKCQEPLMEMVDILTTTEEDTGTVFGIRKPDYRQVAKTLAATFGLAAVAITLREDLSVWRNNWTAVVCADDRIYEDRAYDVEIVDRVGAGDAFTAGFLFGYLTEGPEKGLRYGNAFSALKHTIPGDFCLATLEETEALIKGAGLRIAR